MNKIISFRKKNNKRKEKSDYKLIAIIDIDILRRINESCRFDLYEKTNNLTQEDVLDILYKIRDEMSREISRIEIKRYDSYDVHFTIFYYEDANNPKNFKYIFSPNIKKKKILEYLITLISIIENEESCE